ncbi:hypothetical protein Dimus_029771 [Dionaea muscipula]
MHPGDMYSFVARSINGGHDAGGGRFTDISPPAEKREMPAINCYESTSSLVQGSERSGITETSAEAKAIAALRNHKEAERRRRQRINHHLHRLRTLLPCNPKTEKATLLTKVVEKVRELNQQTLEMLTEQQEVCIPSDTDDLAVSCATGEATNDGKLILKASLCCEDHGDLLLDLISTLNSLRLKTLRAEMSVVGGRIRNILVVSVETDDQGHGDDDDDDNVTLLRNALGGIIERSRIAAGSDAQKRRRRLDRP